MRTVCIRVLLLVALGWFAASCAFSSTSPGSIRTGAMPARSVENDDLPPSASMYESAPSTGGVVGDALATTVAPHVVDLLRARGQSPLTDGRLAQIALWAARRVARGATVDADTLEAVTRRVGFVGPYPWFAFLNVRRESPTATIESDLRATLDTRPSNIPVSSYGIAAVAQQAGAIVVVVLGSVEVDVAPLPKRATSGRAITVNATVGSRFRTAKLVVTMPTGAVRERVANGRTLAVPLELTVPGVYQIEVFGDGETGPTVLANFPLYADVDEPGIASSAATAKPSGPIAPAEYEERVVALLNTTRAAAHLAPLAVDPALANVARDHARDMLEHRYFAHVSPTRGGMDERLRGAHVWYPHSAEEIALAVSPDAAVRGWLASPGHRAGLLDAIYTHVGVGVSELDGRRAAVLELARERPIATDDVPARVIARLNEVRVAQQMAPLALEASLTHAARAGVDALRSAAGGTDSQAVADAARAASGGGDPSCVYVATLDAWDVSAEGLFGNAATNRVGVAAIPAADGPETFRVVVILRARRGAKLPCE